MQRWGLGGTYGVLGLLGAVALAGAPPGWAAGAGECVLQVDSVPGDSTDAHHRGAIDLVSWSWGVANQVSAGPGAGAAAGRPEFRPLKFVHHPDRATPALFQAAASGRRLASATLVCRRPGAQLFEYLKVTLSDVVVTGLQITDPSDGPPNEEVALIYGRVALEYRPQMPDGSPAPPVPAGSWDLRMNRP